MVCSSCRAWLPYSTKAILHMQTKSQSSGDYPVFDRKSDGIVVICLIPGSGPQSNEGFVVVPAVGVLLSCTDFVENYLPPRLPPLEAKSASGFCGVSNTHIAGRAFAACLLSSGSVRTVRGASLRRGAACSAFSAAAVVLATCGVASNGRRTRSRSRARDNVLEGQPPAIFNFAMRDESAVLSALC
jgi:hypothetical protein